MSAASPEMPQPQRTPTPAAVGIVFVQGPDRRSLPVQHSPFTIGRRTDQDLVITDARVSREHAVITCEADGFYIADRDSKLGTFVNGERVQRRKLQRNDRVEFGVRGGAHVIFDPERQESSTARQFLSQVSAWRPTSGISDLETLALFLEAARKLNTVGVLDEVLVTLIDATLRLTRAERGFVFLRNPDGSLRLAAGRNAKGEQLLDDSTISKSTLLEAATSGCEFKVTDIEDYDKLAGRNSVVAQNLFSVICIPLRRTQIQEKVAAEPGPVPESSDVRGVLYLDSHFLSGKLSQVSEDILRTIATEAAALVENAHLVQAEEAARRYQQELQIAASIQQRLMQVNIPDVPYARVKARNVPCREIGGDFYDVISTDQALAVVVADVCGKGISAALLASILQGIIYPQLVQNAPLAEIVAAANRFLCEKSIGEKYATVVMARLRRDGVLEYISCGHVPPLLVSGSTVIRPANSNLPVGLLRDAGYESACLQVTPGDRLMVVTDGVTEAENNAGEFFGDDRLQELLSTGAQFEDLMNVVCGFCEGKPLNDDCTLLELMYQG